MPDPIETPETPETPSTETPETPEVPEDGDTFPREYVERLRRENAEARTKAKRTDELAERVFHLEVASLGRLQDPSDLPYDADLLDNPDGIKAAVEALITAKPHLASRRPTGSVDQGVRETPAPAAGWGSLFG